MKVQLKISDLEADNFWISYEDFIENFDILHVCKIHNWTESRLVGKFVQSVDKNNDKVSHFSSWYYYELNLNQHTQIIIGIH